MIIIKDNTKRTVKKIFFFSFVAALAVSAMAVYTNRNLYKSQAKFIGDSANNSTLANATLENAGGNSYQAGILQDQKIILTLSPIFTNEAKISGFSVIFDITNIEIVDVKPIQAGVGNLVQIEKNLSSGGRITYVSKEKNNVLLPSLVKLAISFKGTTTGPGRISINPSSQIVGQGPINLTGEEWKINQSNIQPITINFTPPPGQPAIPPPGTQPAPAKPQPQPQPQPKPEQQKPPVSQETKPQVYCSQTQEIPFKDISATDTELKKILSCFSSTPNSRCIVNGYPEYSCQSFNPKLPSPCFAKDNPIKKAEAISFISRYHSTIRRDNNWTMVFANQAIPNTEQSYWAYQDILTAYKNGFQTIIDANFKPEDPWLYGFKGIEGNIYSPSVTVGTMTRGEFITKLYNFAVNEDKKVVFTCGTAQTPPQAAPPAQQPQPQPQSQQPQQPQPQPTSGQATLNFLIRLPDVSPSISIIDSSRFRIEVYDSLGGGSIASPVSPVQLVRQGDLFRTSAPLTFNLPTDKPYIVIIKGDAFVKRVFNNVSLRRGTLVDCALNAGECGDLASQRDFKLFFGGDADGFNTLSGSYNRVDSADLSMLASYFNRNTPSTADFNMDGKVDIADLEILGRNYTKQGD